MIRSREPPSPSWSPDLLLVLPRVGGNLPNSEPCPAPLRDCVPCHYPTAPHAECPALPRRWELGLRCLLSLLIYNLVGVQEVYLESMDDTLH